jgi:hypothetical protein
MTQAEREVAAEASAREVCPVDGEMIEQPERRVLEQPERVGTVGLVGVAVARQVHHDDPPAASQPVDELLVLLEARGDPVQEHERRTVLGVRPDVDVPKAHVPEDRGVALIVLGRGNAHRAADPAVPLRDSRAIEEQCRMDARHDPIVARGPSHGHPRLATDRSPTK